MPVPLAAGSLQLASLAREVGNRVLGIPDVAATLAGLRPWKRLRLRVVCLRDGDGEPVVPAAEIEAALAETARVLERAARTRIVPAGGRLVETPDAPAPAAALDAPCSSQGLWRTDLGPAGAFFRGLRVRGGLRLLGRGAPLTVFVVRDVVGKCGCSLGPLGDYVTVDADGLGGTTRRILAHELGHSCGLPHAAAEGNLMRPRGPGERLGRWQTAVLRTSRHVTYF